MTFCHKRGFIHRDLKPQNILLNEINKAVVADLGTVRNTGSGKNPDGSSSLTEEEENKLVTATAPDREQQQPNTMSTADRFLKALVDAEKRNQTNRLLPPNSAPASNNNNHEDKLRVQQQLTKQQEEEWKRLEEERRRLKSTADTLEEARKRQLSMFPDSKTGLGAALYQYTSKIIVSCQLFSIV